MYYICVQPDLPYFHWQVRVMLTNFKQVGINLSQCHVVWLKRSKLTSDGLCQLELDFPEARFFKYQDEREDKSYIPSIKPYGMYLHFSANKTLESEVIFYHDCDIIFREKIDENKFLHDDKWYLSDTVSYIGWNYIKSKGESQAYLIAKEFGIDAQILIDNQNNSGGAQYVIKNASIEYWNKTYMDSTRLYKYFCEMEKRWKATHDPNDYPLQKWCAEMWATLWNAWFFGYQTVIDRELDFCFATSDAEDFFKYKILHNAGVTEKHQNYMFFKGGFININPFETDLSYVENKYCSYYYKQAIESVVQMK